MEIQTEDNSYSLADCENYPKLDNNKNRKGAEYEISGIY